jgi:hypothetical protein
VNVRRASLAIVTSLVASTCVAQEDRCPPPPPRGDGVEVVDLHGRVGDISLGREGVWVAAGRTLVRLDPQTRTVVATIRLRSRASELEARGGSIWLLDRKGVSRISLTPPRREDVRAEIRGDLQGLAVSGGAGWVGDFARRAVVRIEGNGSIHRIPVPLEPISVLASDGEVWVSGQGDVSLAQIDARSGRLVRSFPEISAEAVEEGVVWVIGPGAPNGAVRQLDTGSGRLDPSLYPTPILPVSVAAGGESIWVARWVDYCDRVDAPSDGPPVVSWEVVRLDAATLAETSPSIPVGQGGPAAIHLGFGALWTTDGLGSLLRIDLDAFTDL